MKIWYILQSRFSGFNYVDGRTVLENGTELKRDGIKIEKILLSKITKSPIVYRYSRILHHKITTPISQVVLPIRYKL